MHYCLGDSPPSSEDVILLTEPLSSTANWATCQQKLIITFKATTKRSRIMIISRRSCCPLELWSYLTLQNPPSTSSLMFLTLMSASSLSSLWQPEKQHHVWPHAGSSVKSCDRIFKLTTCENTNTADAVRYTYTPLTIKSTIWDVCHHCYWSDSTAFHSFVKVKAFVVGLKKWCELVLRTCQELLLTSKHPRDLLMIINSKPKPLPSVSGGWTEAFSCSAASKQASVRLNHEIFMIRHQQLE